ncbi:MAG TPA: nodulation protein NfeD [Candidatus Saccharimonadales bacterium]|nr:nodulation protein NfeD [Candidatus Saccharimonadales bacterium]
MMRAESAVHRRPVVRSFGLPLALALSWLVMLAAGVRGAAPHVDVLTATGAVDNVLAGYITDGIHSAANDGAAAVVIELNTPGGSLDATSQIVSALLTARVPTIVWVAPPGGRAASAGTFIMLAAAIAVMAPGTNIGAASPVGSNGQDITGTEGQKVRNDAIANITSIAETRHRNVAWAVSTVASAKSSPASEAVAVGAVDGIAATLNDVLAFANGRTVEVNGQQVTVNVAGASINDVGMTPFQEFLHTLSDPNLTFILFMVGFVGLLFEVIHPNLATGTIGGLALILGFIGSGSLPLNIAGLLLLALSVVLLFLEATVPSHGLLTVAGLVCFVLGASAFYTAPGPDLPVAQVSWPVVGATGAVALAFAVVVVRAAFRLRRMSPTLVAPGLSGSGIGTVGQVGEVRQDLAPAGSIYVAGEEWSARSATGQAVPRGLPVRVIGQEGLTLIVEPVE